MNDSSKKDKIILEEIKELVIKINYHDHLYYNENKQKIICYPCKWFGVAATNHDTSDLFPNNWCKIDFESDNDCDIVSV